MRSARGSPGKNTEALIWDLLLSPERKKQKPILYQQNKTHDLDLWYRQSKSAAPGCIWHFTSRHVIYCKSGSLVKFGTLRELSTERTDCRWLTSSERKTAEHGKQTALTHKPQQVVISSAATLHTPVKALCYKITFIFPTRGKFLIVLWSVTAVCESTAAHRNPTKPDQTVATDREGSFSCL